MIVDRDGGRSPGELRGEKAVGRVEAPLIHLGPWEPRRLRRGDGRRLATNQAIFVTETLARSCLKMDGTEVGPPVGQLRQRGTHTVETCESKNVS